MRLGGDGHRERTRTELAAALDTAFTRRWRFEPIELLLPGDCTPTLKRFSEDILALPAREKRLKITRLYGRCHRVLG